MVGHPHLICFEQRHDRCVLGCQRLGDVAVLTLNPQSERSDNTTQDRLGRPGLCLRSPFSSLFLPLHAQNLFSHPLTRCRLTYKAKMHRDSILSLKMKNCASRLFCDCLLSSLHLLPYLHCLYSSCLSSSDKNFNGNHFWGRENLPEMKSATDLEDIS